MCANLYIVIYQFYLKKFLKDNGTTIISNMFIFISFSIFFGQKLIFVLVKN